ncbi:MAG: acyl-CoA dehydrogenase [Flavobacterium sp.]|jgi:acyl-CoA dehydrogenase
MMINLEIPEAIRKAEEQARMLAEHFFRPISRKYDKQEHDYPTELDAFADLRRMGGSGGGKKKEPKPGEVVNGSNMSGVSSIGQLCWGDVGLMMAMPGSGLGNAAIGAAGTPEQKEKYAGCYAAMAITEPGAGSDSKNVSTTATLEGDQWVLNGEKIFVSDGERCSHIVVWATLDKSKGKAAIKSFIVEKGTPGCELVRVEDKLGLRASDTATIRFENCHIDRDCLLGDKPEVAATEEERKKAFGGVMQTFDNTRPMVAAMAIGVARGALDLCEDILGKEGITLDYNKSRIQLSAIEAELYSLEADWEAARLLVLNAAWMADNGKPNSTEASMSKAKAGRMCNKVTLSCVKLCNNLGYSEENLLEKFARDSKILDIFEGTQQIQQLIIARNILGKSSSELK